jgi:hypothetical protein
MTAPASNDTQIIWIQRAAPEKPKLGLACNGCGVCCLAEPCPVALVFLWQKHGACRALEWDDVQHRYHCGLLRHPSRHITSLPALLNPVFIRLSYRWIAAGKGCDSTA